MTFEELRDFAVELPGVEEGASYGTPALKVRGKLLARLREDGETLALKVDPGEREALVQSQPGAFFVTPHYERYPMVVVRLAAVDDGELRELLVDAWRAVAPRRLVAEHDQG